MFEWMKRMRGLLRKPDNVGVKLVEFDELVRLTMRHKGLLQADAYEDVTHRVLSGVNVKLGNQWYAVKELGLPA
jgi:hypothetical protein